MLKCSCMNDQPNRFSAAIAAAWRAIVRAFTKTPKRGDMPGFENETTLFGGLPDQTASARARAPGKDDFWNPSGESGYFADGDSTRRRERR